MTEVYDSKISTCPKCGAALSTEVLFRPCLQCDKVEKQRGKPSEIAILRYILMFLLGSPLIIVAIFLLLMFACAVTDIVSGGSYP